VSAVYLAQMLVFAAVLVTAGYLLGGWMARVLSARRSGPVERAFLRLIRSDGGAQDWRAYATAPLIFSGVDLYRSLVYVLVPLAALGALVLVSQGTPQTLAGQALATTVEGGEQAVARGPVATQVAIRHLGTNGGGFYNTNAATVRKPDGVHEHLRTATAAGRASRLCLHVRAHGRVAPALVGHPRRHGRPCDCWRRCGCRGGAARLAGAP
jgi:K+-transporting ATPase A subunit